MALKSSASSLGPAGLGSSGLLALITECAHWQTGSSTPTTPSPPPPGQRSPFPQRQIPSSRVKNWEMGQKVAGMIWNGDPENWPSRKWIFDAEAQRGLWGTDFPSWTRFPSSSCVSYVSDEFWVLSVFPVQVIFPPGRSKSVTNLFRPFALVVRRKTQNLIGLYADWQDEVICPNSEKKSQVILLLLLLRKQSVKVVCPGVRTTVCEAVPLWHQMGGRETGVVLPHCVPVCFDVDSPFTDSS